jgi:hypothetical protein
VIGLNFEVMKSAGTPLIGRYPKQKRGDRVHCSCQKDTEYELQIQREFGLLRVWKIRAGPEERFIEILRLFEPRFSKTLKKLQPESELGGQESRYISYFLQVVLISQAGGSPVPMF